MLADEVLPSGKVVRKVMVAPDHPATAEMVRNPEAFGFSPRAPGTKVSIGEHALGHNVSPFLSASTKPGGAPNFTTSMNLTRGLRVVQIIGLVVSVYDLAKAGHQSIETRSAAPITREGIRQVGGWGGAVVGMKIGGTVGRRSASRRGWAPS